MTEPTNPYGKSRRAAGDLPSTKDEARAETPRREPPQAPSDAPREPQRDAADQTPRAKPRTRSESSDRPAPRRTPRADDNGIGVWKSRKSTDERPARTQDDARPPRRDSSSSADRPPRRDPNRTERPAYGGSDRPRRDSASSDRPRRDATSSDRPRRSAAPGERSPRRTDPVTGAPKGSYDPLTESRVYGLNTCSTVARERRPDIVRAYFTDETAPKFGALMKQLAAQKRAYRVVPDVDLNKITESTHHGGVCFIVKKRAPLPLADFLAKLPRDARICLPILEGIGNPHNLGAVMRSSANFGTTAVLISDLSQIDSGAAQRTAEGGAEYVDVVNYTDLLDTLETLRQAGFVIAATSSHQGADLYRLELPSRVAVLFGEESQGLSKEVLKMAEISLKIPGTGNVESLNVSVAASLILGEFWRQNRAPTKKAAKA